MTKTIMNKKNLSYLTNNKNNKNKKKDNGRLIYTGLMWSEV